MTKRLPAGTISTRTYRKSLDHKLDRISYFIAMNGPSNKKTLEKRLKIDKPTIYKAIHKLCDVKRIVIHHDEMSGMVKYYELTPLGIWHVLAFVYFEAGEVTDPAKTISFMKRLFIRYRNWLPEIASLWPAIEEVSRNENEKTDTRHLKDSTSLEELALYTIMMICDEEIAQALRREKGIELDARELDEDLVSKFLLSYLGSSMAEDYYTRWLKALQRNPILREATVQKLLEKIKGLEHLIRVISN